MVRSRSTRCKSASTQPCSSSVLLFSHHSAVWILREAQEAQFVSRFREISNRCASRALVLGTGILVLVWEVLGRAALTLQRFSCQTLNGLTLTSAQEQM
jgi:hypothetical protein